MKDDEDEDESSFLGGRIAGAVVVAAGTYAVLWYWDTWELSQEMCVGIAGVLGLLSLVRPQRLEMDRQCRVLVVAARNEHQENRVEAPN